MNRPKKSQTLTIRLTDDQKTALVKQASGNKVTVSRYVLTMLFHGVPVLK